ncbi:hypothetical protein ACFE04_005442 [Oxalis oulophora]
MGLKDLLNFNFKAILRGNGYKRQEKNPEWMKPLISHGYHIIDDEGTWNSDDDLVDPDSVFAQREQINDDFELWFFGVFDPMIGAGVAKYLRSNLFDIDSNESQFKLSSVPSWNQPLPCLYGHYQSCMFLISKIKKRVKKTMKKAFMNAASRMMEEEVDGDNQTRRVGSASVIVVNGKKLVIAKMDDYKAVVCRNGQARHIGYKNLNQLSRKFNKLWCPVSAPEVVVGTKKIHSDTEFVIIASNGIWEVMKSQEAVSLIRHIKDPQAAARILTREAMNRMTKNKISCLVIRFN